jgi:hypothetical protein
MKNNDEFLKKMENLQVPDVDPGGHPERVKMAIMNAERSAALGVWLIVVPCYFLFCVFMYYYFHGSTGWFGAMFKLMSGLEKTPYIDFLGPLILFVLPIVCIIINALAITHVQVQKPMANKPKVREFSFTIKLKLWNILLILISLIIVCIFINYVMTESISIKN